MKVRRLLALLEEEFGPVEGARPKLTIVRSQDHKELAPERQKYVHSSALETMLAFREAHPERFVKTQAGG